VKRLIEFAERIKAQEAEHERKMATDPVYRSEVEAREAARAERYAGYEVLQREENLRAMGLPERLAGILAGQVEDTPALVAVRDWLDSGKTFLVLGGNVGVGKTVAAAWALSERAGIFRKASQITRMSQFDAEAWDRLYRAGLLVVDDLGTEPHDQGGWGLSALLDLFDRRYEERARTILTVNVTVDTFRERYGKDGGRFLDRLRESGTWFNVAGESRRKPEAA
jgi:DNA replication protein DnaC